MLKVSTIDALTLIQTKITFMFLKMFNIVGGANTITLTINTRFVKGLLMRQNMLHTKYHKDFKFYCHVTQSQHGHWIVDVNVVDILKINMYLFCKILGH
jgi:hypothetical protein